MTNLIQLFYECYSVNLLSDDDTVNKFSEEPFQLNRDKYHKLYKDNSIVSKIQTTNRKQYHSYIISMHISIFKLLMFI